MTPPPDFIPEELAKVAPQWDLNRLHADLAKAKKTWAPQSRAGLTPTEKQHLLGLLGGYTPSEIAKLLQKQESTVKTALSETLYRYAEILTGQESNSLKNWRDVADWLEAEYKIKSPASPSALIDWNGAPDALTFCGRAEEIAALSAWIGSKNCRVVAILGLAGIGKTAVSVKLVKQIQKPFERAIWRSLRNAPPIEETLADLLQFLEGDRSGDLPPNPAALLSRLMEYLHRHRCLLVLDDWDAVLRGGELAGHYLEGYEGYGELLDRLVSCQHRSCLLFCSREKPREIVAAGGNASPVYFLEVRGLQAVDAQTLLETTALNTSQKGLDELIDRYGGNPLALKLVSTSIQELYNGKISDFLEHSTFVGDILTRLLSEQFSRLTDLEKEIVYWLAIARQPVSPNQLKADIWLPVSMSDLLVAIESLRRRSLIEKNLDSGNSLFTLQPIVMKYVTRSLIQKLCEEIFAFSETRDLSSLGLLRSLKLDEQPEEGETRQFNRLRLILKPIQEKLSKSLSGDRSFDEHLHDILLELREKSPQAVGHAAENILLLLEER